MHVRREWWKSSLLFSSSLLISCGAGPEISTQPFEPDVPTYRLVVVDSFGEEMGDSLTLIGSIEGFCYHHEGCYLVLDGIMGRVRTVSESGPSSFFGSKGHGPGAFYYPQGICAMEDGRILVSEPSMREVLEFDSTGAYIGKYMDTYVESVPSDLYAVDSNSVVGYRYEVDLDGRELRSFTLCVGRFDAELDPSVRYYEYFTDLSTPDFYVVLDIVGYCADHLGRVYLVPGWTEYWVEVFNPDGSVAYEIAPEAARLEKTDEEIKIEIAEFEDSHTSDRGYTGGYEPPPFHPLIELAGVDTDGCLWIKRLDQEDGYLFDVWDSTGSPAYRVALGEFVGDLDITFHVDRYGILGANLDSDYYPRVYTFELQRTESDSL